MLRVANAIVCTSGALLNNQALQRNNMRQESTTISAHATTIPPCCNTFMTSYLLKAKIRHSATSAWTMVIMGLGTSKGSSDVSGSSLIGTRLSQRLAA